MSLARNVFANYGAQIYISAVGLAVIPFYARIMGAEAFGLLGFAAMLQAWFNLLDFGLVPSVARQVACCRSGVSDGAYFIRLFRRIEVLFLWGGGLACVAFWAASGVIAERWLNAKGIEPEKVHSALVLIGCGLGFRWMALLYRAVLTGQEQFMEIARLDSLVATFRFVGVFAVFALFGVSVVPFFVYQLLVSVLECGSFFVMARRVLPERKGEDGGKSFRLPESFFRFSLGAWFASFAWVAATQVDKLVLSRQLALSDYGAYAFAAQIANGVFSLSLPITSVAMPRLSLLFAQGEDSRALSLYRGVTQLVVAISVTGAAFGSVFSVPIIDFLVGNSELKNSVPGILSIYVIGSALCAVNGVAYTLQFSRGSLSLHLWGSALFSVSLVISVLFGVSVAGGLGAAAAWMLVNGLYFMFWIPVVHGRFAPGIHLRWMFCDVLKVAAPIVVVAMVCSKVVGAAESRTVEILEMVASAALCALVAIASSDYARKIVSHRFRGGSGGRNA